MLRALVALLIVANLGFFAWTQGWLDTVVGVRAAGDREPERLVRQVHPELIRILPQSAASEPALAALSCIEAGPFGDAEIAAAQAALQAAAPGTTWADVRTLQPGTWIIYMGKFADRAALTRKQDELKRRDIAYEAVAGSPALAPGLSLGQFDDKANADNALAQFTQQGVRTAQVVEITPPTARHRLRLEKADAALAARLAAPGTGALAKGFAACEVASRN